MNSRMNRLIVAAVWLLISFGSAWGKEQLKLNDLIEEALQNNPDLIGARHEIAEARARIPQAEAWEPPQIGVEFFQTPVESFPNPADDSMELDYFIQQMVPFPGKRSAMGRSDDRRCGLIRTDGIAHLSGDLFSVETAGGFNLKLYFRRSVRI